MQPSQRPVVVPTFLHRNRCSTSHVASVCATLGAQIGRVLGDSHQPPWLFDTYPIRNIHSAPATAKIAIRTQIVVAQGFRRRGMVVALPSRPARQNSDPKARQAHRHRDRRTPIHDGVPVQRRSEGKFSNTRRAPATQDGQAPKRLPDRAIDHPYRPQAVHEVKVEVEVSGGTSVRTDAKASLEPTRQPSCHACTARLPRHGTERFLPRTVFAAFSDRRSSALVRWLVQQSIGAATASAAP